MAVRRSQTTMPAAHLIREAEAIFAGAVALFLALSFVSFAADAPRANLGGPVGHALAGASLRALGIAAYLFPIYLGYFTVALLRRGAEGFGGMRLAGALVVVVDVAALAGLATGGAAVVRGGGWLGGFLAVALHGLIGGPGTFLLLVVALVVALVLATGVSALETGQRAIDWARTSARARTRGLVARLRGRAAVAEPAAEKRARPSRPPILLDDAIDDEPEAPEEAAAPPPIIREPEKRPDAAKRVPRRNELQEELFAEDNYRLPALGLLDEPVRT
ncbi:MAG TPA: DNA translocase FtsK 4TM domain-containing protein, partial [Candidatus Binatia bacterium]|nr:DNA translocase FtsK 4TM domain-containing protein [Candidatus Binatia bacterium]